MSYSPVEIAPFRKITTETNNGFPDQAACYPEFRYMGSKRRLLPWIFDVLNGLGFDSAWDPFSGSGCVAYLIKTMGKRVITSDFLNFPTVITRALVENPGKRLDGKSIVRLLKRTGQGHDFISRTPLGPGISSFRKDPEAYLRCLTDVLFLDAKMCEVISFEWTWKDVLIERLRCGRGSAIQGQRRGRFLEDEVEKVIQAVFGDRFERGINFTGLDGRTAKAEFAIPNKDNPSIIFEAKAYGATGSKQTDVIGDIEKIVKAKKPATDFLFITDGMTWKARAGDFRKIIIYQNDGYIRKIYTLEMMGELQEDLKDLKHEHGL